MINRAEILRKKLQNREPVIGTWLTIGHTTVAEILASEAIDYVCIDMEHTTIDYYVAQTLILTIQSLGKAALVRVAKNDEVYIKKALDSGADGIIVPMIKTPQEARKALSYTYYPPLGERGVGLVRANLYSKNFISYRTKQPQNILFVAQIEHIDGINNLASILEIPGIDATFIGPYDLSGSMGFPGDFSRQNVKEALNQYSAISEKAGIPKGFHIVEPDSELLKEKIKNNYQFIAYGVDYIFMMRKLQEAMLKGCTTIS